MKGLRLLDIIYGNPGDRGSPNADQEIRLFTSIFLSAIHNDN